MLWGLYTHYYGLQLLMEFNKDNLELLREDAAYLQDEVEALKYVIHNVPFDEKPGGTESILEMVALIDHAQVTYYRPILEYFKNRQNIDLSDVKKDFHKSFKLNMQEGVTVETILNKIIKHRAALLNLSLQIPAIVWQKKVLINHEEKSLFDIFREMVLFEREQLKKVADRVMSLERETPRPGDFNH